MFLKQEEKERLVDFVDEYVFDLVENTLKEGTFDSIQSIRDKAKIDLFRWLSDGLDPMSEELVNDSIVLEDLVNAILDEFEEEDPEETCDEASLVKHKISKIQSILDKRKRKTDPKWKMSRRRTLMKIAARGGRVVNRKISKAVKRSYRQGFGKRWEDEALNFSVFDILSESHGDHEDDTNMMENNIAECDCGKEDCEFCNPKEESAKVKKELATKEECKSNEDKKDDSDGESVKPKDEKSIKKLTTAAKVQKEAVRESLQDAFHGIKTFGTLSENDSNVLIEKFTSVFMETFDRALDGVTSSLIREFEEYRINELIPEYNQKVDQYIAEEILPKLESDVSNYLDYIVNEQIDSIMESGRVFKSKETTQLEEFRDELLKLISSKLQIIPEQEDALIALENKNKQLTANLHEARVAKVRANQKLLEMENSLWIERNLPNNLSEAGEEKLRELLGNVEFNTHEGFIAKAKKIIESFDEGYIESNIPSEKEIEKSSDMNSDIVNRTLDFMRKK